MSNERIDLTQFEGITEGPWEYEMLTLVTAYPHQAITINQTGDDLRLRLGKVSCPQDGKAMAKLPELIAELKRCYDLIDAQKENLEFLNGAIEKLHEETWTEAVVEFVEEHHPSEWCDYSHCWKCEEESTSE